MKKKKLSLKLVKISLEYLPISFMKRLLQNNKNYRLGEFKASKILIINQ